MRECGVGFEFSIHPIQNSLRQIHPSQHPSRLHQSLSGFRSGVILCRRRFDVNSFCVAPAATCEGNTVVGAVARLISASVRCGRMLVSISPAAESFIRAVPSIRQNASASSVSTRLHWGQRFMTSLTFYRSWLQPHAAHEIGVSRIAAEFLKTQFRNNVSQRNFVLLKVPFQPGERLLFVTQTVTNLGQVYSESLSP